MTVRAGQIIRAALLPQPIADVNGDENIATSTAEPLPVLVIPDVLLIAGITYRIFGSARLRPVNSADNGRTGNLQLLVGATVVARGRATTNAVTNATTSPTWCHVEAPAFVAESTGLVTVAMTAERPGAGSWTGHLEVRGSGGEGFPYRLAIHSLG